MTSMTTIAGAARLAAATLCALAAASSMAAVAVTDTTRQERMDAALQDYRNQHPESAQSDRQAGAQQGGTFERAENSIKNGARRTGHAVAEGARKAGHAVGKGVRKTGDALHRTGQKMEGKSEDAQ